MNWYRSELRLSDEAAISSIAGLPGAFRLCDAGRVFVGAFPCETSHLTDPDEQRCLEPPAATPALWPRWVGVLPYEAFRAAEARGSSHVEQSPRRAEPHLCRPQWQRYEAVAELQGDHASIQGCSREAVQRLRNGLSGLGAKKLPSPAGLSWAEPAESGDVHWERVRNVLELIEQGALYQVNLARRFRFSVTGDAFSILDSLGKLAQAPFAAALDLGDIQVVSTSPELFLELTAEGRLRTRPIKGTRPRHENAIEDDILRRELDASEKERAELAMVIDIERNDLGRVAQIGSVKMVESPHVVSYPTVHHREALLEARLRGGISRRELIETMCPSGSVTGAPKIAAMRTIAKLEAHRRGLYTGALGYLSSDGGMRLSMAIRVLTIKNGEGHYFAGGGIVADSDPAQELEETLWKSEQLRALIRVDDR